MRPPFSPKSLLSLAGATALPLLSASPAAAHVKWFAPYIVGAPPQPIAATLGNIWFWTGIVLVLVFFLATRFVERSPAGEAILQGLDRATDPLWLRLDDFVRVVIGAFFVAIFAIGGVYLTPDLKTPAEWVSWMQLLIAALIFSRRTQPLAAAGIIGLWLLALRDYDIFHLLDYLALGVGVAGYLVLEAMPNPDWRARRFEVLRWGVAIALMWSSLEKFAYPDWFYPLVEEKPFLTFGMPRDVFIPMAGVAEFTMGFGLIWTPLVRRLSAIALFVIFNAAVYPFGRVDLIGHALIMAIIVAIAADRTREVHFLPAVKRALAGVPAGLAAALVVFVTGYWGLHVAIYGAGGNVGAAPAEHLTHTPNAENPHGVTGTSDGVSDAVNAAAAYQAAMDRMHGPMMNGIADPDPDAAFVRGMIPHHQGAIDMAETVLKFGKDPENQHFAREIIDTQTREISEMRQWLRQRGIAEP
ncbi:DUF305 domain-containing protein [Pleomorphomonas diazotrophica]|uniref:DUF305 domain-containing protein n=1 Tax=Pleomorphomonas diazotrophica TaxID=1166257 RepID=A0A1I4WI93_9HYPH|nr:DUF305 domain-containing protein [Pleomorphomonas diazotrophica]PKR89119.1 DUF305 domain-containing protein [Pleomorphomonas diazotrophica]SFN12983.1 protein of unknown function [Pleomorphomonas diazotrophica]